MSQEPTPLPGDVYAADNLRDEYRKFTYTGKRTLDFSPFADGLNALSADRLAEIETLVIGATIPRLQAHFDSGALTSQELTLFYLHRIRAYDVDGFNSLIELNPEALHIAEMMDAERQAGQTRGLMHGIPVTLKDNISTGDSMHTAAGAAALANHVADRDAFLVERLREVGAVILGKNNLSEWANFMTFESANGFSALGGQTRNAYGRFGVGGSSSGSAVAVAQNFTTVSLGTETSGSLIYPASQNSVATFKPSLGLISRDRVIPITEHQDSAGPMARNMTDLLILLDALKGIDANDPQTQQTASLLDTDFSALTNADALRGVRVGMVMRPEEYRAEDNVIRAQALDALHTAGAEVVPVPPMPYEGDIYQVLFFGYHEGVNAYLQATSAPVKSVAEIIAFNAEDLFNRAPYGQTILEACAQFEINEVMRGLYAANAARNRTLALGALRTTLHEHDLRLITDLSNYSTITYAMAGTPALNLPAGYRSTGEPLGLTIMGDWLDDATVLAAGYAFEQTSQARKEPL